VRSGDLDLAVVFRVRERWENGRPRPDEGFDEVYLADDPYRVALPLTHPLAPRRTLRLAELAAERFIAPPGGGFHPYRILLEQLCAEAASRPTSPMKSATSRSRARSSPQGLASPCCPILRCRRPIWMSRCDPFGTSSRLDLDPSTQVAPRPASAGRRLHGSLPRRRRESQARLKSRSTSRSGSDP
jgi:DNA-binding transcriptional LysR family regulator